MELIKKTRKQKEYQLTQEEFIGMIERNELVQACLSETMGPNWKDIYWSPMKRPFVKP